jgi:AcrR family transcriptional regulator
MARAARLPASERRRRIIEAARSVFASAGYAGVGTAELAKAAGVSEAALYRYFPSKKHLFLATLGSAGGRLQEIWRRLATEVDDPIDALRSIALGYYEHARSRSDVMRLQFRALSETNDPEVQAVVRKNFGSLARFVAEAIREGQRRGLVRADVDASAVAWQFIGMGLAVDVVHLLGVDQQMDRRRAEGWVNLFLGALRPGAPVDWESALRRVRSSSGGLPLWQPLGRDMPSSVEMALTSSERE